MCLKLIYTVDCLKLSAPGIVDKEIFARVGVVDSWAVIAVQLSWQWQAEMLAFFAVKELKSGYDNNETLHVLYTPCYGNLAP